jgi:hypothetical protein
MDSSTAAAKAQRNTVRNALSDGRRTEPKATTSCVRIAPRTALEEEVPRDLIRVLSPLADGRAERFALRVLRFLAPGEDQRAW